jgi:hypothetical protein
MKAIVVMDQAAGTAEMKLVERPEPPIEMRCKVDDRTHLQEPEIAESL